MPKPTKTGSSTKLTLGKEKMEEKMKKIFKYYAVQFIGRGRVPKTRSVDVVLFDWLEPHGSNDTRLKVRYPAQANDSTYNRRLKGGLPADPKWPLFTVVVRGKSDSYDEILQKLDQLRSSETALTLSSEEDAEEVTKLESDKIRRHKFLKQSSDYSKKLAALASKDHTDVSQSYKGGKNSTVVVAEVHSTPKIQSSHKDSAHASHKMDHYTKNFQKKDIPRSSQVESTESSVRMNSQKTAKQINRVDFDEICTEIQLPEESQSLQHQNVRDSVGNIGVHPRILPCEESLKSLSGEFQRRNVKTRLPVKKSIGPHVGALNESTSGRVNTKIQNKNQALNSFPLLNHEVLKELRNLRKAVVNQAAESHKQFTILKSMLSQVLSKQGAKHFLDDKEKLAKKYGCKIPFSTSAEFEDFDTKLAKDQKLVSITTSLLHTCTFPDGTISKNLRSMMRLFLSKDAAMLWVASKKTPGKKVFKETNFFKIAAGIIKQMRIAGKQSVSDQDFKDGLSSVLTNVKTGWKSDDENNDDTVTDKNMNHNVKGRKTFENAKNIDLEDTNIQDENAYYDSAENEDINDSALDNVDFNNDEYSDDADVSDSENDLENSASSMSESTDKNDKSPEASYSDVSSHVGNDADNVPIELANKNTDSFPNDFCEKFGLYEEEQ